MTRAVFLVLLVLLGCGDTITATQVIVRMNAQAQVLANVHDVQLTVRSGDGETSNWQDRYDKKLSPDTWPIEFSLVPKNDDATRVYEVTATALDVNGEEIAQVRVIGGFVAHKRLTLTLRFDDACIGKVDACDEDETCKAGTCVGARNAEGNAVASDYDAGTDDHDASTRAEQDASTDGGQDFVTDASTGADHDAGQLADGGTSAPDAGNGGSGTGGDSSSSGGTGGANEGTGGVSEPPVQCDPEVCGAAGKTCCDDVCVDTAGACMQFPCFPGSEYTHDVNNCGSCGKKCAGYCCSN